MNSVSLVTAYYDIPSNYAVAKYIEDIIEFFKTPAPIIIFTNSANAKLLRYLRRDLPINIIETPFEELETWKLYGKYWDLKYRNDKFVKLYALRCQKAFFMDSAAKINPFSTDYFMWCDISVLNKNLPDNVKYNFPQIKLTHKNPIFMSVFDCPHSEIGRHPDGIFGSSFDKTYISSRIWCASADGCRSWRHIFENMLILHLSSNRPINNDSSIMLSAVINNQDKVFIVKPSNQIIPRNNSLLYINSNYSAINEAIFQEDNSYALNLQSHPVSIVMIGGLGNQMFQLATAYAYARKYCGQLNILREKEGYDRRPMYWNSLLERWTQWTVDSLPATLNWHETAPPKFSNPPRLTESGLRLCTYLQSSKYFFCEEIKNELKLLMKPSVNILNIIIIIRLIINLYLL